jgi:hypothetical protein
MKKQLIPVVLFVVTVYVAGWCQSALSVTYPFGLPCRSYSGTALNMGGVSVGIPNDHHVMLTNPGNLGTIKKMSFSSLLLMDYLRVNDNNLYTDHINVAPRQISLALPFDMVGTFAFSLSKETDVSFKFYDEYTEGPDIVDTIGFHRAGGTGVWQVGWGYSIGKWINIGIAYKRLSFSIRDYNKTILFDNSLPGNKTRIVNDSVNISFKGNGIRFGLLGIYKKLSAGLAVEYIFMGKIKQDSIVYNEDLNLAPVVRNVKKVKMHPPPSVSLGIAYNISPKWLVGSDFSIDLWQEYYIEKKNILAKIDPKNTLSFSLGTRFIPAPKILAPKYWETIHYRAGARYTQLPGRESHETSLSIGFGLPLKGNGLLDIGFDVGRRYTDLVDNYNETFLQVGIGINGGRKWHKSSTTTY